MIITMISNPIVIIIDIIPTAELILIDFVVIGNFDVELANNRLVS